MIFMNKIEEAREIVLKDLRSCYLGNGILASQVNFSDYWARDSFWASFGLIEAGIDLPQVKSSLKLFLDYQHPNGKIPRKVCLEYNGLKYLGMKIKRKKPRPIYVSSIRPFFSFDDNLLFVIAFCKYVEKTRDVAFAKEHMEAVNRALAFYGKKSLVKKSLLCEFGFGNWMDTIFKRGFVLYTNALWYEAVKEFEKLRNTLGGGKKKEMIPDPSVILDKINEYFWDSERGYFSDTVRSDGKQQYYFDLAGNVLAVFFGIANKEQSGRIFKKIGEIYEMYKGLLHPINHPRYPFWKISPVLFLFNIQDYQNQISWSWIEVLLSGAYTKCGRLKEAEMTLNNLSGLILSHGHIHETYYLDGRPFDHLFWKSAVPFAWGAGLFLWAVEEHRKA